MNGDERLRCVRYEMTQREFRRLRREKWSPSFISKLGKLATKLYKELYRKEPPYRYANKRDIEPVNLYPYGILEQAYRRLIAAGENVGEPYQEPDPALKPRKPTEVAPLGKVALTFSHAFSRAYSTKEEAMRLYAKIAAERRRDDDHSGLEDDTEQDDEIS